MDIRKIKKLIELLEESTVAEIEIREGEESLRIRKGEGIATPTATINAPPPAAPYVASVHTDTVSASSQQDKPATHEGHIIKSPMVGIFYTSPSPDALDFVAQGQNVKSGEVLCIIEAMKIMNQIESDVNGKLTRRLVENGEAVEYGQPLFIIDPV